MPCDLTAARRRRNLILAAGKASARGLSDFTSRHPRFGVAFGLDLNAIKLGASIDMEGREGPLNKSEARLTLARAVCRGR
jgi:hypothetical protein